MSNTIQALVPTTYIWDEVSGADNPELLLRLYQYINQMSLSLNQKDSGFYGTEENINGQQYYPNTTQPSEYRAVMRKVIPYLVGLPNTGTVSIPHGISTTPATTFTRIYGVANHPDTVAGSRSYLPLPFAHPTSAQNIALEVNGSNIVITTGSNRSTYTVNYIILEYLIT